MSGLLSSAAPSGPGFGVPVPSFQEPATTVLMGNLQLGTAMDAYLDAGDPADGYPPELRPYMAGLQPSIPPAGTPWQEEIVFDRIARTDAELQSDVRAYFSQAQSYDRALRDDRIKASDYYNGRPLGDEESGRSQLVLTTVRDTIRATLPSLLRVFTGVQNPVEFVPYVADNEQLGLLHAELARQATQYATWALFVANDGWTILHDALLDALTRKAGWFRWSWGQQRAQRIEDCNRLLLPQLQILLQEPGISAQRVARRPMLPNEIRAVGATPEGAAYLQAGGPPVFWSARITRAAARAWPMVRAVRPECVWIVGDAETVQEARAVFHVRDAVASDLIAAGLPKDRVLAAASQSVNPGQSGEARRRDPARGSSARGAPGDKSMQFVRYVEGWCRLDTDGDGVAELVHVHALGDTPTLIRWDRTDEIPLAAVTAYRESGRVIGLSQADMVMDLQKTQTRVMRAILDSLNQSIFPRTVVQIGAANVEDARQTAIGTIIRATQQGAVQELTKPFVGAQAMPVMESLEAMRESRTGITRSSQGLTAESLQSTSPVAVGAQVSAAQDRLDMIARTAAETGLAPLYLGLLRLMAKHQDRPNVLSLRGKWIAIDPRALSTMWAVQVNVGGRGTVTERLAILAQIASKQEQILAPAVAQGMLDTPLVGLLEYRNTLARMCETAGLADVTSYFKELPPNWQPPPPPQPKPSPEEVLAQVEQQKLVQEAASDAADRDTDRLKIMLEDDRSRDEAAVTAWVQSYGVAAKTGAPLPSIDEFRAHLAPPPLPGQAPAMAGAPALSPQTDPAGIPEAAGLAPPVLRASPPAGAMAGLSGARGAALMPPPGGAGMPGRVASLPLAVPANAAPPGARVGIDPATVLALRQAILRRGGDPAGGLLAARALAPQDGQQ